MQGGLPASSGTRQFAQELLDKLPGKSGSNGRPPIAALPNQRTQEAAARAFLKQNAQYALLEEEEDEDAAPELPAPTTAALPKKREKKLRKERAGNACIVWHTWYQLCLQTVVVCIHFIWTWAHTQLMCPSVTHTRKGFQIHRAVCCVSTLTTLL